MNEDLKKKTMEFVLLSLIHHVNVLEMTDDEREDVLNITFNVLTNTLQPDCSYYFNEAIFEKVEKFKKMSEDNDVNNILKQMGLK